MSALWVTYRRAGDDWLIASPSAALPAWLPWKLSPTPPGWEAAIDELKQRIRARTASFSIGRGQGREDLLLQIPVSARPPFNAMAKTGD
ncbi:hypothetical protein [Oleomonas cavernae]|uniref:hypothetical protein n=1 Tax=Oleomonas cavernae TaxID=2320859 RepID=UPI0011C4383A|nr:hypothetical protein [Oleomonas cavernae]